MALITISRGTFSGGKTLAECLAARLGYRCIDRDAVVEKAAVPGVSQDVLRAALQKPPSFLDRIQHKKYAYLTLIQAALVEEVRGGNAIYHGNAGHLLLKGGAPVLRTRIIAPMELRVKTAMGRMDLSQGQAVAYINKVDQERRRWTSYLYGVDWGDPSLYDIVLNLECLDIARACDILADVVSKGCFEFDEQRRASMDDLALASRLKADLVLNRATESLELDIVVRDGIVTVKGKLAGVDQCRKVEQAALALPGVKSVNMDELASPNPD